MSSKSHIYFEKMKHEAKKQSDRMNLLHKLFGFDCSIPDAPVTRSNRISDFSMHKGVGPELKKVKKVKRVTNQPINYRESVKKLLDKASEPLSSVRVASILGVAKSTAQAHLQALYAEGYLVRYALEAIANRPLTYLYSKK
jgi:Fic family protein